MEENYEMKFLTLEQGSRYVVDYKAEFHMINRFVVAFIDNDVDKAHRFQGLRSDIRMSVAPYRYITYKDIVERTYVVEEEKAKVQGGKQEEAR